MMELIDNAIQNDKDLLALAKALAEVWRDARLLEVDDEA
jgi:hypothetical protein